MERRRLLQLVGVAIPCLVVGALVDRFVLPGEESALFGGAPPGRGTGAVRRTRPEPACVMEVGPPNPWNRGPSFAQVVFDHNNPGPVSFDIEVSPSPSKFLLESKIIYLYLTGMPTNLAALQSEFIFSKGTGHEPTSLTAPFTTKLMIPAKTLQDFMTKEGLGVQFFEKNIFIAGISVEAYTHPPPPYEDVICYAALQIVFK